jgi:predicted Zn-dependent protease with MMP-like domain
VHGRRELLVLPEAWTAGQREATRGRSARARPRLQCQRRPGHTRAEVPRRRWSARAPGPACRRARAAAGVLLAAEVLNTFQSMTRQQFEKLVEEALKTIPARFRREIRNVAVIVEDEPSEDLLDEMGIEPPDTLFGLYQGTPLTERGWSHGNTEPDRITIYQGPVEDACETRDEMIATIGETVIHEFGHYFGLSEEEIEEIEERYWRGEVDEA